MRVWHPALLPTMDDNRLAANHYEIHVMLKSLQTEQGYFSHPETQVWWGREANLAWLHDLTVIEMRRRGGNHATPTEIQAVAVPDMWQWEGLPEIPYKATALEWFVRDLTDLYVKYANEDRFDINGWPNLGRRTPGGFKPVGREILRREMVHLHISKLHELDATMGAQVRVWTDEQKDRLREMVRLRRTRQLTRTN